MSNICWVLVMGSVDAAFFVGGFALGAWAF